MDFQNLQVNMIDRKEITEILCEYDVSETTIGVLASHSALDVCDGQQKKGSIRMQYVKKDGRRLTQNTLRQKGKMGILFGE